MEKTNMQILLKAEKKLSYADVTAFDAYMLGALSVHTDRAVWLEMIEAAKNYMARREQERAEEGEK